MLQGDDREGDDRDGKKAQMTYVSLPDKPGIAMCCRCKLYGRIGHLLYDPHAETFYHVGCLPAEVDEYDVIVSRMEAG